MTREYLMQTRSYQQRSCATSRVIGTALLSLIVGCGEIEPSALVGVETPVQPPAVGSAVAQANTAALDNDKQPAEKLFTVYKNPGCQCCDHWVEHMKASGFSGTVVEAADIGAIKQRYGIEPALQSCHTAVIDGYVFEGHIPAAQVAKFLAQHPTDKKGLAVPGMPVGSPGMEMGDRHQAYDVIALNNDGTRERFAHIGNKETGQ